MTAPPTVEIFGPAYRERIENTTRRPGDDREECCICGRPTSSAWYLNLDNGPENFGDQMGWFPVGAECRRAAQAAGWEVQKAAVLDGGA